MYLCLLSSLPAYPLPQTAALRFQGEQQHSKGRRREAPSSGSVSCGQRLLFQVRAELSSPILQRILLLPFVVDV
jgi:hypothetical protein